MKLDLPDFAAVRGRSLLVALSGGADSAALLHMLAQKRSCLNLTLHAAHVDHCIRGQDSQQDAQFCRALCENLGVPLYMEEIDVPALARATGEGLETVARRMRYDFLRRTKDALSCDYIALAHHQDDQAETVLMHLLRGCGPGGIGGMETFSGELYRPLLNVKKAALEQYLRERKLSWRVDATNYEPGTPRNQLRLHGIPALEESYPQAGSAIARYAEAAMCENRFMEKLAGDFLREHTDRGPWGMRIRNPEQADEAILRRAIRAILKRELPHDRLLALTALCRESRGRIDVSKDLFAERTPRAVYFLQKEQKYPDALPFSGEGEYQFSNLGRMILRPAEPHPVRNDPHRQVLNAAALKGAILRTRRDGDRIRPLGGGEKLLSDYFTDRKVDRPLRDFIPLVAIENRILWAVGLGISEEAKLTPDTSSATELYWNPDKITSEK